MKSCYLAIVVALCSTQLGIGSDSKLPATDENVPGQGTLRRHGWFQNLWEKRRSAWAKQVQQDQGALVFLGDSITQGWGGNLSKSFPEVKVANRGISGDTTRGVLLRLEEDVIKLNPSGVVILIGTNDLEEGDSADSVAGNLKLIISQLKKHNSKMPILLCQVMPSSATKRRPAGRIREINQKCFAVVRGDPQITVLDTWTLFADT